MGTSGSLIGSKTLLADLATSASVAAALAAPLKAPPVPNVRYVSGSVATSIPNPNAPLPNLSAKEAPSGVSPNNSPPVNLS